jgi:hypothetical protein
MDSSKHAESSNQEPDLKYLVEDLCDAFQEGVALWDERIGHVVIGQDVHVATRLRLSFEKGHGEIGKTYSDYFHLAGKHFAYGNGMSQLPS